MPSRRTLPVAQYKTLGDQAPRGCRYSPIAIGFMGCTSLLDVPLATTDERLARATGAPAVEVIAPLS